MAEERISRENLDIELISEKHKSLLETFKTDNTELRQFLIDDAISNQEMGISYTYLWFYKKNNELVAYITLLADAIRVHGTRLGRSFLDKGVDYKTLPAMKIGKLCVHKAYRGCGIGTLTTDFAMKKLLAINENECIGCRFLIADAKKDAVHFYKKMHFEILKEREKGTMPMYYDMIDLLKYRRDGKKSVNTTKA